jgi:hypothetical protein
MNGAIYFKLCLEACLRRSRGPPASERTDRHANHENAQEDDGIDGHQYEARRLS